MDSYNMDIETRDKIIFGLFDRNRYMGGCSRFRGLTLENLKKLLEMNFIDPEECQNYSPSTKEFLEFMEKYPDYTAHGYTIIDTRDDYRVTLEGIEKGEPADSKEELYDFIEMNRYANEFDLDDMYCWYD